MKSYGDRVQQARLDQGLSRKAVIELSSGILSPAKLSNIEKGREPAFNEAQCILEILAVELFDSQVIAEQKASEYGMPYKKGVLLGLEPDLSEVPQFSVGDMVRLVKTDFPLRTLEPGIIGRVLEVRDGEWGRLVDVLWIEMNVPYPMFVSTGDVIEHE
jgi:transcriptional regulator with XRE-family HTH domain